MGDYGRLEVKMDFFYNKVYQDVVTLSGNCTSFKRDSVEKTLDHTASADETIWRLSSWSVNL